MTPKEKARELRDRMYLKIPSVYDPNMLPHYPIAREMALIAVDEIIEFAYNYTDYNEKSIKQYWKEVKQELQNL